MLKNDADPFAAQGGTDPDGTQACRGADFHPGPAPRPVCLVCFWAPVQGRIGAGIVRSLLIAGASRMDAEAESKRSSACGSLRLHRWPQSTVDELASVAREMCTFRAIYHRQICERHRHEEGGSRRRERKGMSEGREGAKGERGGAAP